MNFAIPASAAMWFLPFAAPVGLWVAWSDMARMKIPNPAVGTLVAVYALVGLLALPLALYLWQWLHLPVVLVLGFVANQLRLMGAGDAKFAAALAPFVALGDVPLFCYIFAAVLLAAFALHRLLRKVPAVRRMAPGWESWDRDDFPMGLALGSVLILYLALAVLLGA